MRRREFITLIGGAAAAWPLAVARAQQAGKLPTIGYMTLAVSHPATAAFVERLRELGWIEGRTVTIEYRWAEGRTDRVAEIAAEFVRQKVDVIVTYGGAVTTLKRATASIPIVFAVAVDPVGIGLVASLSLRNAGRMTVSSEPSLSASGCRRKRGFWPEILVNAPPLPAAVVRRGLEATKNRILNDHSRFFSRDRNAQSRLVGSTMARSR